MKMFMIAGSLRRESLNKKLLLSAQHELLNLDWEVDIGDLNEFEVPLYNQDEQDEQGIPAGALRFTERMQEADGAIFCLPEYNFSISGVFKNLIDWVSRISPNPWKQQKILLMSASPSLVGGNRGLWVARMSLESLGSLVYPGMFSLASAHNELDAQGHLNNSDLQSRLHQLIIEFTDMVKALKV